MPSVLVLDSGNVVLPVVLARPGHKRRLIPKNSKRGEDVEFQPFPRKKETGSLIMETLRDRIIAALRKCGVVRVELTEQITFLKEGGGFVRLTGDEINRLLEKEHASS